jgi:DNA (cytosine-5)-methyltransferase 1
MMPSPNPADIRLARMSAGITQAGAGLRVHVGLRTWQKWELGERKMHPAFWELFKLKVDNEQR